MTVGEDNADDLVKQGVEYVTLIDRWVTESDRPAAADKTFRRMHQLAKALRETPVGRERLVALLEHENPAVRLSAAAECLAFDDQRAIEALQLLAPEPGLIAFSAGIVLEQYWAGTLNMDW